MKTAAQPQSAVEVKPCPHCGSAARFVKLWSLAVKAMTEGRRQETEEGCVRCDTCKARSATGTEAITIEAWNMRIAA